jgi:small subunit ribosomal protein S25e
MSEKGREYTVILPEGLYKRISREIRKEPLITPYMLAERYNMTVSLAKKVLRRLEAEGIVKLYSKNRRAPIYVPVKSR